MLRAGSGCALVALLAVALAAVPAAADEEPAAIELPTRPSFDPREAVTKVAEYQAAHPEFAAGIATWVTAGISLFILGNVVLVWSEIQAMLVVRDQDFRARLLLQDYIEEGADIDKLNKEESANMHVRPYLSVLGTLLMFMGLAAVLYPLCDVITVIGLPATPCILLVTFGSLFAAICVATTWMFFIWLCTRPVAAVIFLVISVSGQLLIPSGNPILLLLWMLVTFGGGWAYFFWLPDVYRDKPQDKPAWVQDVGTFRLSYEPGEVMDVIGAKVKLEAQKFKPVASTLGAQEGKTQ